MAWVAEETFDSYTNGAAVPTLNGGTGWSAAWVNDFQGTNWTVTNSGAYQGTNAIICASGTDATVRRDITSAISDNGIVYFVFQKSTTAAGQAVFYLKTAAGAATRVKVQLGSSGNIELVGTTTVTVLASYSINTWYAIRLTFDVTGNTAKAAYSTAAYGTAGAFSVDSSSVTMNSTGNIADVLLAQESGTAVVSKFDYISGTSPFTGGSATHNLTLTGVGS